MLEEKVTIGSKLKVKYEFEKIELEDKKKLFEIIRQIRMLMWKHIFEEGIVNCKWEGEEVATLLSFSNDKFQMYMENSLLGEIDFYGFHKEEWKFYTLYIPFINSILVKEGIRLHAEFSRFPILIKVILL